MKNLLFSLLLIYSDTVQAQFAPFPTPGLEHGSIYVCNPWDCTSYHNISTRYEGDTILCGKTWNKFGHYVRAEQGKYYKFINCNSEVLMYDFSKELGDTVVTGDLGPLKVMEVSTLTLENGETRKKMVMKSLQPSSFQTYTWVDGIGDIDRSFYRSFDFEGGYSQLICLRDTSGVFYEASSPIFTLDCDSLLCLVPQPRFEYSCVDMTYYFTNSSKHSDGYYWDFGDGESSIETNPTHTYSAAGCYVVTLKAKAECLPQDYSSSQRVAVNTPFFWKKSPHETPVPFTKMQFLDPDRGWALGDRKIWKTADGGSSWDSVPYPGPVRPLGDLHFKDFEHGIVKIFKPGAPYYYSDILWTNDGTSWETMPVGTSLSITALERLNDSAALVASHYQNLFITKNWGQTWDKIQIPWLFSLINDFEQIGGDTVYLVGINQFTFPYTSTVFGKTYNLLQWSVQEFPGLDYGEKLSFISAQEGWMGNKSSVYHTIDGGETWTPQLSAGITELDFVDSLHGWASGYSGIFGTANGGNTWEEQACSRAGQFVRGLNAFSPTQAYIFLPDGLYKYSALPDTVKLCETTPTTAPNPNQAPLFSIYPNPTSGVLNIHWHMQELSDAELVLFSAQGMECLRWHADKTSQISVTDLPPGLYFLQARSLKGKWLSATQKLIVLE